VGGTEGVLSTQVLYSETFRKFLVLKLMVDYSIGNVYIVTDKGEYKVFQRVYAEVGIVMSHRALSSGVEGRYSLRVRPRRSRNNTRMGASAISLLETCEREKFRICKPFDVVKKGLRRCAILSHKDPKRVLCVKSS